MDDFIIEIVEMAKISGHALKLQRMNAGLSQRALAELLRVVLGDQIVINGSYVALTRENIARMENEFPIEFFTTKQAAKLMQRIFSKNGGK